MDHSPAPSMGGGAEALLQLPHEPEAEKAVLGAVLLDPASLLEVMEGLRGDEFYLDSHRLIYAACVRLRERGDVADLLTVSNRLREDGLLERVGGVTYLSSLVDAVPDVAHVGHYAAIVRDKAVKRSLIGTAQRILASCTIDHGEAREAVEAAQRDVSRIAEAALTGGPEHIAALARQEMETLEASRETRSTLTGVDTGLTRLNELTSGLQRKDLIILAARPSMGKTSLGLNICAHAALRSGLKVAIFSLEMSTEQLVRRMLASIARVNQRRLATGYLSKSDWTKLTMAAQSLQDADIWIDDTPGLTPLELLAKARRLKHDRGIDLVMVDYLQLMVGGGRYGSRNEEVSAISRTLKGTAKDLDVPMLVLSQLSRQPDRRGGDHRPQLSDLRESGSIEQDADVVLFIIRPAMYDQEVEDQRLSQLIVAKQRNGPVGEIELVFQHEYTRFENAETGRQEPGAPW